MERPILFNDAMVRAILSGAKAQTRRAVLVGSAPVHHDRTEGAWRKLRDGWAWVVGSDVVGGVYPCPFGAPGDRLWVRECFYCDDMRYPSGPVEAMKRELYYRADGTCCDQIPECQCHDVGKVRWRPSIHMPRWASRLTLRVTDVRVERVQAITEADARAEGVYPLCGGYCAGDADAEWNATAREAFAGLWRDTYGAESWTANPWVWVVSFERETAKSAKGDA